jgi:hypothetical protein
MLKESLVKLHELYPGAAKTQQSITDNYAN